MNVRIPTYTLEQVQRYLTTTQIALKLWKTKLTKDKKERVNLNLWQGHIDDEGRIKRTYATSLEELWRCNAVACLGGMLELLLPELLLPSTQTIHQVMGIGHGGVPWHGTHGELDLFSSRRRKDVTPYEEASLRLTSRVQQLYELIAVMEAERTITTFGRDGTRL